MDKAKAQEHLAEADNQIREAKAKIAAQRERIVQLAADGHPIEEAEKLLANYIKLLRTMEQHRAIIQKEVKENKA